FAELSTMFPRPGAVIFFPKLCFGMLAAQIFSWVNFLAYVSVAPVEAVAVVSYADNIHPGLLHHGSGLLTLTGLAAAMVLMAAFIVINLLAIRLVLRLNNIITWWKLIVPALTIIALMATHFRAANFTQFGFAPAGAGGVLGAVSGSGIIFTFLGFRQAIELAGESANPARQLPFAILGSVLLCLVLYLGLQAAFIGALSPADLASGWAQLHFTGISGPFAGLAAGLGLSWLAATLYADAAISPGGTGIIYATTAARVVFATADEGLAPSTLARLSPAGVPVRALGLSFLVGLLFLAPLPSWRLLVTYLSSIGVLAYGIGPVVLVCLRDTMPVASHPRPFRLKYAGVISPCAFIIANLVVFWAGADVADHLFGGLAFAFLGYTVWQRIIHRGLGHLHWRGAAWIAPYFAGLWLLTWLGPDHGQHILGNASGALLLGLFSLLILRLARACALAEPLSHIPIARR
ncbi:MAG: APC family permease, partial [Acidocella sp.]|nr:APC family permease [Acidocella sp.]